MDASPVGPPPPEAPRAGTPEAPRAGTCDLSTTCLACGQQMRPEHAHYRCPACGWRDSCCDGPY